MKALLSITPGGPETLALSDVPEPKPGRGDLLVRVLACAINYPDVLLLEDRYQVKPPRPFAPGTEIAGVVEAIGEGVDGWREGQRLIAMIGYGGLAERALVPAERAFPLPDGLDAAEGSALLMTYA
ncbi:MAG TPA: alcohol dehydrogenase catalytic domain-containing protein, partial [Sphingomonas sp.]|nr:alcohol dehydrogenase catalytic domain-containing protein [Sphingomonas sp.]